MKRRNRRGFTLLEVMVALSILALALVAIAGINANSFEASNYARHITVATLLGRSKMLDIELDLQKDGFSEDERETHGDFSDEGFTSMKWSAVVRPIEVDVGQLFGGLFGGEMSAENLPEQMQSFLGAMRGESSEEVLNDQVGGSELSKLLGGGQMELIFKQVGETLKSSIREITVEITWGREGIDEESVKFVQYVTTTGRLNVPNFQIPAQSLTPGGRIGQVGIPPLLPGGQVNSAAPGPAGGTK